MFLCFLKQQSLGCWCLSRISALLRAGVQATHVCHSKVEQEMLPAPVQPLGTVSEQSAPGLVACPSPGRQHSDGVKQELSPLKRGLYSGQTR